MTFADGTITASFNTASGVLTLTAVGGSASFTDFQTALDHVRFSHTGDPTGGGTDPTRTLTWTVVDTNQTANNTGSSTSTINTAHTPVSVPTGGTGVLVTYTEGQTTTTLLDSGVTLADTDLGDAFSLLNGPFGSKYSFPGSGLVALRSSTPSPLSLNATMLFGCHSVRAAVGRPA